MTSWNKSKKAKCNEKNWNIFQYAKKIYYYYSLSNIRARHVRYSGVENLSHIDTTIHPVPNKVVINK
jgi:hypothetical protein